MQILLKIKIFFLKRCNSFCIAMAESNSSDIEIYDVASNATTTTTTSNATTSNAVQVQFFIIDDD